MSEAATTPAVDKATIRGDLERTHEAYKALIGAIPDDRWNATSGNRAFTVGQLAWHLATGFDFTAGIVENARKGKQTNVPSFLMPLAYKINEFQIRRGSRKATRNSVLADYERGQTRLLRLLDDVSDAELAIVKTNFGDRQSIGEMFNVPVGHFAEHSADIRAAL